MSYGGEQLLWLQEGGGTADGASKRDRSAGDSNDERGVKRAAEPSQAQGAPRKKATPGPRVKSRICQVVGCNIEYSSTHECRARACQTHCSALSVRPRARIPRSSSASATSVTSSTSSTRFGTPTARSAPGTTATSRRRCGWIGGRRRTRRPRRQEEARHRRRPGSAVGAHNRRRQPREQRGGEQSDPGQRHGSHGSRQGHATDDRERAATPVHAPVAAAPAHDQTGRRRDCFRAGCVVV